jgi:hypothetical protein
MRAYDPPDPSPSVATGGIQAAEQAITVLWYEDADWRGQSPNCSAAPVWLPGVVIVSEGSSDEVLRGGA